MVRFFHYFLFALAHTSFSGKLSCPSAKPNPRERAVSDFSVLERDVQYLSWLSYYPLKALRLSCGYKVRRLLDGTCDLSHVHPDGPFSISEFPDLLIT